MKKVSNLPGHKTPITGFHKLQLHSLNHMQSLKKTIFQIFTLKLFKRYGMKLKYFLLCSIRILFIHLHLNLLHICICRLLYIPNCGLIHMSRVVGKPAFCICENKDADQLRGNREADQRLFFRYIDSTIPLLSKSEISSL